MQQVVEHLRSLNYPINEVVPDGKIHRFGPDRQSYWIICFQNFTRKSGEKFYVASFGNWTTGERHVYNTLAEEMTSEDRAAVKKQMDDARVKADREKKRKHEQAKEEVQKKWECLSKEGDSAYLRSKQVGIFGIRFDGTNVYIPLRDVDGTHWSLQKIQEDGGKFFYPGGKVQGCFHSIGPETEVVYCCEGYATGASIYMATGKQVLVAFNAGNLVVVAEEFKKKNSGRTIIVCGDDDRSKEKNVGREKAEEAARRAMGVAKFPVFVGDVGTDYNDVHCLEGLGTVAKQLEVEKEEVQEAAKYSFDQIVHHPYPDEDSKGKKSGTLSNVAELLKRLEVKVRYNVISKEQEVIFPGKTFSIDNRANCTLAHVIDWCERVRIPTSNLNGYLTTIADSNPHNPVAEWIESKPWDGESRLEDFYETIHAPNTPMKKRLMRAWLVSAVAAAYSPNGIAAQGVLVLQGPQYIGKTKWFKSLAPAALIADGMILHPDDKDSVFQAVTKWIVELGELDATFRKSDISQLKAFITKDQDVIRRPYAKAESVFARRTVFCASVNDREFLADPTGNRRYWTIECETIDYNHCVDMQQLWAEVHKLYSSGESFFLSGEEMKALNNLNESFEAVDPIEESIHAKYHWDWLPTTWGTSTATTVCKEIGINNPSQRDTRSAARALRKLSGGNSTKLPGGSRVFNIPPIKS